MAANRIAHLDELVARLEQTVTGLKTFDQIFMTAPVNKILFKILLLLVLSFDLCSSKFQTVRGKSKHNIPSFEYNVLRTLGPKNWICKKVTRFSLFHDVNRRQGPFLDSSVKHFLFFVTTGFNWVTALRIYNFYPFPASRRLFCELKSLKKQKKKLFT
jgi:hypothetical protein